MSKFNSTALGSKTVNLADGEAFTESPELALASLVLTSFGGDQHYRTGSETYNELKRLIEICDPLFVAKTAIYARKQYGMRTITHVAASEISKRISGQTWAKDAYKALINRPDDITEILSYHFSQGYKLTHAMRKGLGSALSSFDAYKLAKYQSKGKAITLVDAVNLLHPRSTEALTELMKGTLKPAETWETKLTQAGQKSENETDLVELKKEAWESLIKERKIGYFALLRNLRNIIQQAPQIVSMALLMLVDKKLIRSSLVLPFRYISAMDEIEKLSGPEARTTMVYLNKAIDISFENMPMFEGTTCVVLDISGSMSSVSKISSLFTAALVKANNADLIVFENSARYVQVNIMDSVTTISNQFRYPGGGTNFNAIFPAMTRAYNRIIILSDMQGWVGYYTPIREFSAYKVKYNCDPKVYSFDLQGYGTLQFPERNVYCLSGFSEKVFDIMKMLETDRNALINEINKIEL